MGLGGKREAFTIYQHLTDTLLPGHFLSNFLATEDKVTKRSGEFPGEAEEKAHVSLGIPYFLQMGEVTTRS